MRAAPITTATLRPLLIVVGIGLGASLACREARPPTAPSAERPTVAPPTIASGPSPANTPPTHRLIGVVMDESGKPVPDVRVELDYPSGTGGANSTPTSRCPVGNFCWLTAVTDANGVYRAEFTPGSWGLTSGPGYVYAWAGDSQVDVQPLAAGTTDIVQNLTMRAIRRLGPGEATVVTVDGTSSLCTDLEDYMSPTSFNSRCAAIVADVGTPGVLRVDARTSSGEAASVLFFATTGNYAGFQRGAGAGVLEVPISGGRYQFYVGLPIASGPRDYQVSVSLR